MTQVFLLYNSGNVQYFPDPGDWNPVNTIEIVASGGYGSYGVPVQSGTTYPGGGAGGGGGGYGVAHNVAITTWPVPYMIFQNNQTGNAYQSGFGSSDTQGTGAYVSAQGGFYAPTPGTAGSGGAAGKPAGYAGGSGGAASTYTGPP